MPLRGRKWMPRAAALGMAIVLGGCASGPRLFVNPDADMTFYRKVALIPFGNLSPERYASLRVTRAFITELLIANRFALVDPEDFRAALTKIGAEPGADGTYDPDKLKRVATDLEATGLIRGAVTEYQIVQSAGNQYATISFDAEMIDVASGNVVWRISMSKRGKSRVPVVGGSGTRSFGQLTQDACREAVSKLTDKAF